MNTTTGRVRTTHGAHERALYMAFDLGNKLWHIAFGDGSRERFASIPARDLQSLRLEIDRARKRFNLRTDSRVISCYEAGRDGFWLHRHLENHSITNLIVDPASIEASRRKRRAKTDRIDARKLLRKLIQYQAGDRDVWCVLHVPTREQEHERRLMRHRAQLQHEINSHTQRIRSLLILHGVTITRLNDEQLQASMRLLGPLEQQELTFAHQRLTLAREQLRTLESQQKARMEQPAPAKPRRLTANRPSNDVLPAAAGYAREVERKVAMLTCIKAVGRTSAWRLATEFFWRDFSNRREVGSAAGLTSTPFNSGDSEREQGISKVGNSSIRDMMVELAWLWIRWQPDSKLTQWFNQRWAVGKRQRKIGIVAVARQLLIALWRFLQFGVVPDGATLKPQMEAA